MKLETAIKAFTLQHPVREKKLVAVSGGRDSVALLHALHEAGHRRLVVCHLNHKLRGRASAGDEAFVKRLAARLGLTWESAAVDVKKEAAAASESLESAGRRARHRFLAECARRQRCWTVVMAHHADDQAETVLFNLFRGSSGLRGMGPAAELTVPGFRRSLRIVRPLLGVTRAEIDAWIAECGISFREDASNAGSGPVRNKIRHTLLPAIFQAMGRDVRPALGRAAELAGEDSALLDTLAAPDASAAALDAPALRALPAALQRRVIYLWLRRHGFPGTGFLEVESVRAMLAGSDAPVRVNLPGNRFVRRSKGKLHAVE